MQNSIPAGESTYVFLTNNIGNIGGGQIYVSRKTRHLKEMGWNVVVYHYDSGKVMIDNLKPYEQNHVPGLCHRFGTLTRRQRRKHLERMAAGITGRRVIIESYTTETALWGEALARYLFERGVEASHFCYILVETPAIPLPEEKDFLMFKRKQGMLRGIMRRTLHNMMPEIPVGEGLLLAISVGPGNFDDVSHPLINEPRQEDFIIMSVGRLEKPYVVPMMEDVKRFAQEMDRRGETVRLIMIGDSHDPGLMRDYSMMMAEIHGLSVEWWGFTWPVPAAICRLSDVYVGSAGSIVEASAEGIPAVALDAVDHKVIGIYGETTSNYIYRDDEPQRDLYDILLELRHQRDLRREARKGLQRQVIPIDFESHDVIMRNAPWGEYYDVDPIPPRGTMGKILRVANALGAERLIYMLKERKLKKRRER